MIKGYETDNQGGTAITRPMDFYAGETYTTLTFDFEKMTGRDMVSIETEMQMNNEYCLAPEVLLCTERQQDLSLSQNQNSPINLHSRNIHILYSRFPQKRDFLHHRQKAGTVKAGS